MSQPVGRARPRALRASDADREAYAHILEGAYAEGRIDAEALDQRSGTVWTAGTVGELDDLVGDLLPPEVALPQLTEPTVALDDTLSRSPTTNALRPHIGRRVAVALVAAAAVLVVTMIVAIGLPGGPDGTVSTSGSTAADMFTGDGLREIASDLAEAAGTTQFTQIAFYGDYAVASAPGAPSADRLASLDWREGAVSVEPGAAAADDLALTLFDVEAVIDWDALGVLATTAAERTGITDVGSTYLTVQRVTYSGDRQIEARVNLSNDYQNASIVADHAGAVISLDGPGVESDSNRFLVAAGMQQSIDAVITRIGGPDVSKILFYGEYVSAEAPPEPGVSVLASFSYRGGTTAIKDATNPSQPDDVASSLFSLDDLDPDVLATLVSEAAERTGVADAETTYVYIQRETTRRAAPVRISVYVSGPYESGRVIADLDGTVLEVL